MDDHFRACTVATPELLPEVRVLANSLVEHHPGARLQVLLVGDPPSRPEPFDAIPLDALDCPAPTSGSTARSAISPARTRSPTPTGSAPTPAVTTRSRRGWRRHPSPSTAATLEPLVLELFARRRAPLPQFLEWLAQPAPEGAEVGATRYLAEFHRARSDLRAAFPSVGPELVAWTRTHEVREYPLLGELLYASSERAGAGSLV